MKILYTSEQIYNAILEYKGDNNICDISKLIEKTKIDHDTLKKIIIDLERKGLIKHTSLNDILVLK